MKALNKVAFGRSFFVISLAIVAVGYVWTRLPVLNFADTFNHINSDNAIYSMMAEEIISFKRIPIFFYGQNYMGPLTSIFIALTEVVLNLLGIHQNIPGTTTPYLISPFASTIGCLTMVGLGILFYALAVQRLFNRFIAIIFAVMMAAGNALIVRHAVHPNGVEMVVLLGGLLSYLGIRLTESRTVKKEVLFGFFAGIAWWMNQTIIFVLAPILFLWISQTKAYEKIRNNLQLKDRILLRLPQLGMKEVHVFLLYFLRFVHFILTVNMLLGIVVSAIGEVNTRFWGIKLKMSNGFSPIKTSILIFVALQLILWLTRKKDSFKSFKAFFSTYRWGIVSFLAGYSPVILGRIFGWYQKSYGVKFKLVPLKKIIPYWERLIDDFFPRLLYKYKSLSHPLGIDLEVMVLVVIVPILIFLVLFNSRHIIDYCLLRAKKHSPLSIFWGVFFFNILYVMLSARTEEQNAPRYAILVLPSLLVLVSALPFWAFKSGSKWFATFSVVPALLLFYVNYYHGQAELNIYKQKDKLTYDLIEKLISSPYDLCYANYWYAYKYEYLTGKKVEFIVYKSQDRTREWTREREKRSGQKCRLIGTFEGRRAGEEQLVDF